MNRLSKWMTSAAGVLLLILVLSVFSVQAQLINGGTKTWGGPLNEFISTTVTDGAGNIYVCGSFSGTVNFNPWGAASTHTSNGNSDAFLAKFDKNASFLWVRTWGGAGIDASAGLAVDSSGNVYVSGKFQQTVDFMPGTSGFSRTSNGANDIFLVKYNTNGILQWLRTWGGDLGDDGYLCAVDSSGNVYVVGDFSSNFVNFNTTGGSDIHARKGPAGSFDAYISKHDTNGNFQWARSWGGGWYTDGPSVAVDGSGNVYVAGMFENTVNFDPGGGVDNHTAHGGAGCTNPANCPIDVFLSKYDSGGIYKWTKTWGGNGSDCGSVNVDNAGNIYVSGYFNGAVNFNPWGAADTHMSISASDTFLSKFDPNGNFQWARTFGGNSAYGGGSTAFDSAGNVYVAGTFSGSANFNPSGSDIRTANGPKDIFLTKYDKNGLYIGTRTWGGPGDDGAYSIAINQSLNKLYVAGVFSNTVNFNPWGVAENHTSNGGQDLFLTTFTIDSKLSLMWGATGNANVWTLDANGANQGSQTYQKAGWMANALTRNFDGTSSLMWTQGGDTGGAELWTLDSGGVSKSTQSFQQTGWAAHNYYRNSDGTGYLLWAQNSLNKASIWKVNAAGGKLSEVIHQAPGLLPLTFHPGLNGAGYLLWSSNTDGKASVWKLNAGGVKQSELNFQQSGWLAMSLHPNVDGTFYLLWAQPTTGKANVWKIDANGGYQSIWNYQLSGIMARSISGLPDY